MKTDVNGRRHDEDGLFTSGNNGGTTEYTEKSAQELEEQQKIELANSAQDVVRLSILLGMQNVDYKRTLKES